MIVPRWQSKYLKIGFAVGLGHASETAKLDISARAGIVKMLWLLVGIVRVQDISTINIQDIRAAGGQLLPACAVQSCPAKLAGFPIGMINISASRKKGVYFGSE